MPDGTFLVDVNARMDVDGGLAARGTFFVEFVWGDHSHDGQLVTLITWA